MKNKIVYILLLLGIISCKAQVIGTLEQFEECKKRANRDEVGCPDLENITYVKDTSNRLNQFIGVWKGNFAGKEYEIHFEKKIQFGEDIKWDRIFGRMVIKNNSGNIIYNSLNELDQNISFFGSNFQGRAYVMHFVGNYDCLESGNVFIETRISNPNEMTLFYSQDKDGILDPAKCPNFSTFVPLLPTDKITLIKQ